MFGRRESMRKGVAAAAAAVALAASTAPALGATDGGHGTRQIAFSSSLQPVGGDFGCDPTDPARCGGTFRNVRTLSGDLSGSAYVVGSAVLLPNGTYQGQSVAQFTGAVAGCGSGTMVIIETGILDPTTGDSFGTWTITAGQGTGDLAQTSGQGTADSRVSDVATGSIRCQ